MGSQGLQRKSHKFLTANRLRGRRSHPTPHPRAAVVEQVFAALWTQGQWWAQHNSLQLAATLCCGNSNTSMLRLGSFLGRKATDEQPKSHEKVRCGHLFHRPSGQGGKSMLARAIAAETGASHAKGGGVSVQQPWRCHCFNSM